MRPNITTDEMIKRAKRYAAMNGWRGQLGGWIYDHAGHVKAHGWLDCYMSHWQKIEHDLAWDFSGYPVGQKPTYGGCGGM
jgi:hypothetical protein